MMIKKITISICFLLIFLSAPFTSETFAKDANVTDCLKDETKCADDVAPTDLDADGAKDAEIKGNGSLILDLVKMVFALLLILTLIYVLLKFLNKRNKLFQQVRTLENLGGISVGPNKSIQIVRIGPKLYVVGVGENVEMLQEITDEDVKEEIIRGSDVSSQETGSLFKNFLSKKSENETKPKREFKQLFSNELDKLKKNREKVIDQHIKKEDPHE